MKQLDLGVLTFILLGFVSIANCQTKRLESINVVKEVKFGIYIKSLQLDPKVSQFKADLYWWLLYKNTCDSVLSKDIENMEFVNGDIDKLEYYERIIFKDSASGEDIIYLTGRAVGRFKYFPEYTNYPFDEQRLPIIVENVNLSSQSIKIIPDFDAYHQSLVNHETGLADGLIIPGYKVISSDFITEENLYSTNFGDKRYPKQLSYSRLTFEMKVFRNYGPYLIKILIPLTLIVIMAYLVFFVPSLELEVAVGLTVTSLLAAIALQLTMADDLPSIGYLVSSDQFFYLGYLVITLAMTQTVFTYNLEKNNRGKLAHQLEIAGRWAYPIIYLTGVVVIISKSVLSFA